MFSKTSCIYIFLLLFAYLLYMCIYVVTYYICDYMYYIDICHTFILYTYCLV